MTCVGNVFERAIIFFVIIISLRFNYALWGNTISFLILCGNQAGGRGGVAEHCSGWMTPFGPLVGGVPRPRRGGVVRRTIRLRKQ